MSLPTCVKCDAEVLVPSGASLEARVRCPHCSEEFQLSEMFDELPPALEIVEDAKSESRSTFSFSFSDSDDDAGGSDRGREADEETDPSAFHLEGHSPDPEQHPAEFKFDDDSAAAAGDKSVTSYRPASRPQRKKKNPAAEMGKIVGGGILGIVLAIVGIWWIAGKDPFKLAPTVRGFAPWALPASLRGDADPNEEASDKNDDQSGKQPKASQVAKASVDPNDINTSPVPNAGVGFMSKFNPDGTPKDRGQPGRKNGGKNKGNPGKSSNDSSQNGSNEGSDNFLGIRNVKAATVEEFENSVFAAINDFKDWEATAGRDSKAEDFFASVATLGQHAATVNQNDPEAEMGIQSVDRLLQDVNDERDKLKMLMEWSSERLNEFSLDETGILLAGTVKSIEPQGKLYETRLELFGRPGYQVSVMTAFDIRTKAKPDMKLLVLGAICLDPSKNLGGYSGKLDSVIVTARMFPLSDGGKEDSPFEEVKPMPETTTPSPAPSPFEPVEPNVKPPMIDTPRAAPAPVEPPAVDAPKIDLPTSDLPQVDAPKVDAPAVPAPVIDAPSADPPQPPTDAQEAPQE